MRSPLHTVLPPPKADRPATRRAKALDLDTRLTISRGQSQVNVIEPARRALGVRFFKQREIGPGVRWLRGELNMHKIAVAIFYTCGIIDFAFAVITLFNLAPL